MLQKNFHSSIGMHVALLSPQTQTVETEELPSPPV